MGEDSGIEDGQATTTRRRRDVFAAGGGFTDRATWRRRQTGAGEPVNLRAHRVHRGRGRRTRVHDDDARVRSWWWVHRLRGERRRRGNDDAATTTRRRRRDVFAAGGGFTDRATWRRRQTGAGEPVNLRAHRVHRGRGRRTRVHDDGATCSQLVVGSPTEGGGTTTRQRRPRRGGDDGCPHSRRSPRCPHSRCSPPASLQRPWSSQSLPHAGLTAPPHS